MCVCVRSFVDVVQRFSAIYGIRSIKLNASMAQLCEQKSTSHCDGARAAENTTHTKRLNYRWITWIDFHFMCVMQQWINVIRCEQCDVTSIGDCRRLSGTRTETSKSLQLVMRMTVYTFARIGKILFKMHLAMKDIANVSSEFHCQSDIPIDIQQFFLSYQCIGSKW